MLTTCVSRDTRACGPELGLQGCMPRIHGDVAIQSTIMVTYAIPALALTIIFHIRDIHQYCSPDFKLRYSIPGFDGLDAPTEMDFLCWASARLCAQL